jgi:hypothetical protein
MRLQLQQFKNLTFEYLTIQPFGSSYKILLCNTKIESSKHVQNNTVLVTQKNEVRKFKTLDSAVKVANQISENVTLKDDFFRIHKIK